MAMRWKKDAKETGLARVSAGPRGSTLREGDVQFASVVCLGRYHVNRGWYFVAGWNSGIPYKNTGTSPVATEAEAKAAAVAYVKAHRKEPK